jgi:Protein of unknown function (DUF2735)
MTALTSAKIYTFPPRGRFALRISGGVLTAPAHVDLSHVELPHGVKLVSAAAWYHDEAIQEEHDDAEPRRKN